MKILYIKSWFCCLALFLSGAGFAQQDWPKKITGNNGETIKIYQPQVESYTGNTIKSRSAVSVIQPGKQEPVFGAFWWEANVNDNGNTVTIQSLQVTNIKFPDGIDETTAGSIRQKLESDMPRMQISILKDELQASVNNTQQQARLSNNFNNEPPRVIYASKPSMLVLVDGEPRLQHNAGFNVDVVANSPFTIVKSNEGMFYLYGGKHWYTAASATGSYNYTSNVPENILRIENTVKTSQDNGNSSNGRKSNAPSNNRFSSSNSIPDIIVSTQPAELIQSEGEANFAPVENTSLLYVKNSANDIFMDVNSQQYYVLLSGRWYRSAALNSQWQYIQADRLPADFAKIPPGSPKDNVLASVAGTDQANEAVTDAAIPQTAKVNRRTAATKVSYDGEPEFENISGTDLQYALNASETVLRMNGVYYAVDNGVWFSSRSAYGPWEVSTTRPADVDRIPPSYPVYNTKYVYVYDVTPDYIYTGYTPGYLNAYVYGPTIVYGTGYYYRPWWHHRYFARPFTWGFSMNYTPWYGWGFGYEWGYDWFDIGFGCGSWWEPGYYYGGWWGPAIYHPVCIGGWGGDYYHHYGYYGYNSGYAYRNYTAVNINYTNNINIYNNRSDVYVYNNRSFVNNHYNNINNHYNNNNFNRENTFGNGSRGGDSGNRLSNRIGANSTDIRNQPGEGFGNGRRVYNANGSSYPNNRPYGNRPETNGQNQTNNAREADNARVFDRGAARQRAYSPQREAVNGSGVFNRPQQGTERPPRNFGGAETGRPVFGGGRPSMSRGEGGGESRPAFGGGRPSMGNDGGGGESRPAFGGGKPLSGGDGSATGSRPFGRGRQGR